MKPLWRLPLVERLIYLMWWGFAPPAPMGKPPLQRLRLRLRLRQTSVFVPVLFTTHKTLHTIKSYHPYLFKFVCIPILWNVPATYILGYNIFEDGVGFHFNGKKCLRDLWWILRLHNPILKAAIYKKKIAVILIMSKSCSRTRRLYPLTLSNWNEKILIVSPLCKGKCTKKTPLMPSINAIS